MYITLDGKMILLLSRLYFPNDQGFCIRILQENIHYLIFNL